MLDFHPIDLKFEDHLHISLLNSSTNYFDANIGQKFNISQISKIVNFHPIDLKFEQDFHIISLNTTTNYS